ncbi:MAG TPA: YggT family protein [Acidimicrobiia bacterium]|nr:YggT family protein [Acidimicrobiia bacterium]
MTVVCAFILVYLIVLILRAVLSWFPVRSGSAMASINSVLFQLTEPLLAPLRRVIPPAGMFDLSFLVLFFGILIVQGILCGSSGII